MVLPVILAPMLGFPEVIVLIIVSVLLSSFYYAYLMLCAIPINLKTNHVSLVVCIFVLRHRNLPPSNDYFYNRLCKWLVEFNLISSVLPSI